MSPTKADTKVDTLEKSQETRFTQDSVELQLATGGEVGRAAARAAAGLPLEDRGLCGRRGHGVFGRGESGGRVG